MIDSFQSFCQLFISHLIVQISVIFKENTFCRIHKCVTQIICHHDTVQEFSSGCCIVTSCLRNEVFLNLCKLFIQFQIQSQSVNNFLVSRLDFFDLSCNLFTFFSCPITFIEHVGYFNISIKTLSRCWRNHITSGFIWTDDITYFFKLFRTGKRAATKLHYFFHVFLLCA